MTEKCPFGEKLVKTANEVVKELEINLEGLEPMGDTPWRLWLAGVRHNHTNYDELLTRFPMCVDFCDESEENRLLCLELTADRTCPWQERAHWILKSEASSLVHRTLYHSDREDD